VLFRLQNDGDKTKDEDNNNSNDGCSGSRSQSLSVATCVKDEEDDDDIHAEVDFLCSFLVLTDGVYQFKKRGGEEGDLKEMKISAHTDTGDVIMWKRKKWYHESSQTSSRDGNNNIIAGIYMTIIPNNDDTTADDRDNLPQYRMDFYRNTQKVLPRRPPRTPLTVSPPIPSCVINTPL